MHTNLGDLDAMPTNVSKNKAAKADVGFSTPNHQNNAPPTLSTTSISNFNSSQYYEEDSEGSDPIPYHLQLAWSDE
ncbi:hypothetical protein ACHAW5_006268 [Stephanodiscus triporus]|uniref:Uncharacterized protein n=1 Tax=Stephanodiscus triporus TaxID=2934178 RepID=A0ABD3NKW7_9STRA